MRKHADAPLCPHCLEDRPDMVSATRDGRRVVWHCAVCGKSFERAPDVRDVSGHVMHDP